MKVENLEKAVELKKQLERVDQNIEFVNDTTMVSLSKDNYSHLGSDILKYGQSKILKTVKPSFLSALEKERDDILKEIDKLD